MLITITNVSTVKSKKLHMPSQKEMETAFAAIQATCLGKPFTTYWTVNKKKGKKRISTKHSSPLLQNQNETRDEKNSGSLRK